MKHTLQNNYTTMDQSKRLLELGVPAWTADIMFDKNRRRYELIETEDESLAETQRTLFYNGGAIPHWTVGRLIEIMGLCYDFELPSQGAIQVYRVDIEKGTVIDVLISDLERFISRMDFSKLER